jgi:hypothetical protein
MTAAAVGKYGGFALRHALAAVALLRQPPRARTPPLSGAAQPRPLLIGLREKRGKREMRWHPDMWRPRGSHADSIATSDKIGFKTTEGPIVTNFD